MLSCASLDVIHYRITGTTILELGGGVGLSSLAAALYANTVICTGKIRGWGCVTAASLW